MFMERQASIRSVIPPLVVVEDPPDVWRLDPRAAAVFGAEISDAQKQILCECGRRPIVVFFNRGSGEAAAQAGRRLQAERRAVWYDDGPNHLVAIAELPAGRDAVRQCTAEEAWGISSPRPSSRTAPSDPSESAGSGRTVRHSGHEGSEGRFLRTCEPGRGATGLSECSL